MGEMGNGEVYAEERIFPEQNARDMYGHVGRF